jgi:hypothetical protein
MRSPSTRPEILNQTPWLLAIGQALRAGYTEVGQSLPERLAALVKHLEGGPSPVRARHGRPRGDSKDQRLAR